MSDDTIEVYLKLYILLYADDTVVMAESPEQLQRALDGMAAYCKDNRLIVNRNKTKVVIFSRGKLRKIPNFTYNNTNLEVVFSYEYLGIPMYIPKKTLVPC